MPFRDALEVEVQNQQKQIEDMKAEQVDALGAPMPWEADPELQEMTPTELKSILGDDLTPREKAKLNEMCVQELEKELKAKISAETSHIWQISSLTKELEKNRIKLRPARKPGTEPRSDPPETGSFLFENFGNEARYLRSFYLIKDLPFEHLRTLFAIKLICFA